MFRLLSQSRLQFYLNVALDYRLSTSGTVQDIPMALYYDAAPLLSSSEQTGSLKSRVFNSRDIKSSPKQVYALVSEASKWSSILTEVIEKSQLLQYERKVCERSL